MRGSISTTRRQIQKKVALAKERKVTEICTVSGLHPDFTAQSYTDVYRWIHEAAPGIHLHASNPMEVAYAAKKSRMSTVEVLEAMKEAGLNSMCGTAAEILVDDVREKICKEKIPTKEWVRIITEAHGLGIPTHRHHHVRALRERCGPGGAPCNPAGYPGRDARVYRVCPALVHPHEHAALPGRGRPGRGRRAGRTS